MKTSMIISMMVFATAVACGSSKQQPASRPAEQSAGAKSVMPRYISQCQVHDPTAKYGCERKPCPFLGGDVRKSTDYHVIGPVRCADMDAPCVHVADDCQHYFCRVDTKCVEQGCEDIECMSPYGCMLVHRLERK